MYPDQTEAFEFGRVLGDQISMRGSGAATWQLLDVRAVKELQIAVEDMPGRTARAWPSDDVVKTRDAIDRHLSIRLRNSQATWEGLGWRGGSDEWISRWWPEFQKRIIGGLASSVRGERVPVIRDGILEFRTGPTLREAEVIPPTESGWRRFLELAAASGEKHSTLRAAAEMWWWRDFPHGLINKDAARAATVYTPGTRVSWRGVGDWLAGLSELE